MKKIKVHVATNKVGSECTRVIEIESDMDEDNIQEIVQEVANEMVDIWYDEVE
jgi:Tfp pilus assembly PilM family ATPase